MALNEPTRETASTPVDVPPEVEQPPVVGVPSWRGVLNSLVIDGLCPLLTYLALMSYVTGISQVTALLAGAVFPAANGILGIVHRRTLDIIGAIVLIGIVVSIVATFAGGDPKLLLIRESFVTGALGGVCLLSLFAARPLLFFIARQFSTGDNPQKVQSFNALWERPRARRMFRVLTVVWGVGWVVEFGLRVLMVEMLSTPVVLFVSPIVFNGITVGLFVWTLAYVRYQRRVAASDSTAWETRR
jgi:hypothetical protein